MTETTDATDRAAAADTPIAELAFDDALAELQRTVAELEGGGQPLERALALHERGAALIEHCNQLLTAAELRMQQLVARSQGLQAVDVRVDEPAES